jgi:hypothetical protein
MMIFYIQVEGHICRERKVTITETHPLNGWRVSDRHLRFTRTRGGLHPIHINKRTCDWSFRSRLS